VARHPQSPWALRRRPLLWLLHFLAMFSLLTYRVECDYRPGRFLIIQAESVNDALLAASSKFSIHWSKLSASLYSK
jgi:hypothetical protein